MSQFTILIIIIITNPNQRTIKSDAKSTILKEASDDKPEA